MNPTIETQMLIRKPVSRFLMHLLILKLLQNSGSVVLQGTL